MTIRKLGGLLLQQNSEAEPQVFLTATLPKSRKPNRKHQVQETLLESGFRFGYKTDAVPCGSI